MRIKSILGVAACAWMLASCSTVEPSSSPKPAEIRSTLSSSVTSGWPFTSLCLSFSKVKWGQ